MTSVEYLIVKILHLHTKDIQDIQDIQRIHTLERRWRGVSHVRIVNWSGHVLDDIVCC
jgi:hypothetical protein